MNNMLIDWTLLYGFLIASFVLAVTPGPGVLYIVTRSLSQGRKAGLASVAGIALGNLCSAIGASLGLAALFAISSAAFLIVKYAGALYLIYMGVRTIITSSAKNNAILEEARPQFSKIFVDGFLVALLNPKTVIFFAAFLPQFINPEQNLQLQSILLGVIFVLIACLTDSIYSIGAGTLAPVLVKSKGVGNYGKYISGSIFIGLGIITACTGIKDKK